jgi:hypothetical protein
VDWWAELIGPKEAVLASLGDEDNPIRGAAAPELRAKETKDREPVATTKEPRLTPHDSDRTFASTPSESLTAPPEATKVTASGSTSTLRRLGYGVLGAGAGAGIAGGVFALISQGARGQISSATKDDAGRITNITQIRAAELEAQARSNAVIANVLFVSAGGLVAAGGTLWLLGGRVAVTPAGNGVAVSGELP